MERNRISFGPFQISPDERVLRRGDEVIALAPKSVDTLLLLLENAGRVVSKDEIIEAVWPDVVVDENNLNQQISALRKALADDRNGNSYIETVPKRGYRFIVPVRRAPSAVATLPTSARKPAMAIGLAIAGIVLAAAALLYWRSIRPPTSTAPRAVAVLPFQVLTPGEDLDFVSVGLADAVIRRLAYAPDISVRPTSAVRRYLTERLDAAIVGQRLNVGTVLDGTIQKERDRIRVSMQLIDVASNRPLWVAKFDEQSSDLFALQDLVGEAALRALNRADPVTARRRPPDPEAYEAYLRGRFHESRRNVADAQKAVEYFERAVERDPAFAPAWAGLADSLNLLPPHHIALPVAIKGRAAEAAQRAIRLDPTLAEGLAALGFIQFYYDRRWREAEQTLRRAIELNPGNVPPRQWLANLLLVTGRTDEALTEMEKARTIDPRSIQVRVAGAHALYMARRYEQSLALLRSTLALDSGYVQTHSMLGAVLLELGRTEEAIPHLERARSSNVARVDLAVAHVRLGDRATAMAMLPRLVEDAGKNGSRYDVAALYCELGDRDEAFRWLERTLEVSQTGIVWLKVDPHFDSLRDDPRYDELLRRLDLR